MKKIILLILLQLNLAFAFAVEPPDTTQFTCGFDELLDSQMIDIEFANFQKRLDFYINQYKQQGLFVPNFPKPMPQDMIMFGGFSSNCDTCYSTPSLYVIPIVVHIVHLPSDSVMGMGSNISNEQVHNAIMEMNKSFAAYDVSDTNAVNTGIQFYLAPVGSDSNGIIRYSNMYSNLPTNPHYRTDLLLGLLDSFYSSNRFINVFSINGFPDDTYKGGYATMPRNNSIDAVVVRHDLMGNYNCIGSPLHRASRGKTLAHELGHYLNLYHTFHEGCDGDISDCEMQGDKCCDTPPVSNQNGNSDCLDPYKFSCSGTPTQPGNCMDQPRDDIGCGFWFTRNQTERMHATLQLVRRGLISIDSINQWGVRHCGLAMDFKGKQNILCDPDTVTLYGLRYIDSVHYRWIVHNPNSTLIDVSGWNLHQIKFYIASQDTFDVTLIMTQNGESDTMTIS